MNPRMRRLVAEANLLRTEFAGHPHIAIDPIGWEPPEQYRITYRVPGVSLSDITKQPVVSQIHRVLVTLPAAYPREKPYFVVETLMFHPNIGPRVGDEVCIADYWSPAQTLADLIVKIGDMIQYRQYNVKSPLNAVAARWAAEHPDAFPVGDVGLFQAQTVVSLGSAPSEPPTASATE